MNVAFTPNPRFLEDLAADADTVGALDSFAEKALDAAKQASPSATFNRRLSVELVDGRPALVSTWSLWHIIEYGTEQSPAYQPLAAGVEAAGLQLTDGGS